MDIPESNGDRLASFLSIFIPPTPTKFLGLSQYLSHSFIKSFSSPDNSKLTITQLVRCLSKEELIENKRIQGKVKFNFPIEEDYNLYGKELEKAGLLIKKDFGYYPSRMVSVQDSVNFYMNKVKENPYYCIDKNSIVS